MSSEYSPESSSTEAAIDIKDARLASLLYIQAYGDYMGVHRTPQILYQFRYSRKVSYIITHEHEMRLATDPTQLQIASEILRREVRGF